MEKILKPLRVLILISLVALSNAYATDYNLDFKTDLTNTCGDSYGGIALVFDGWITPSGNGGLYGTPYYINLSFKNPWYEWCLDNSGNPITIVSWAGGLCIDPGDPTVHVGISAPGNTLTLIGAFFYNNDGTNNCLFASNITDCNGIYDSQCPSSSVASKPATASVNAATIKYVALVSTSWQVHTFGKTLTIKNSPSWPPRACSAPVYVGKIRFEYYESRQQLRTLNPDSLRYPLAVDTIPGGPHMVGCLDSITFPFNPPPGAAYVVVSAIQDTVPSLTSSHRSQVWEEVSLSVHVPSLLTPGLIALGSLLMGSTVWMLMKRRRISMKR